MSDPADGALPKISATPQTYCQATLSSYYCLSCARPLKSGAFFVDVLWICTVTSTAHQSKRRNIEGTVRLAAAFSNDNTFCERIVYRGACIPDLRA